MTGRAENLPNQDLDTDLRDLVGELARRVDQLESENQALRGAAASVPADGSVAETLPGQTPNGVSRRRAIVGIGAAAAAAATAAIAGSPKEAAAATGDPVLMGQFNGFANAGLATIVSNSAGRGFEVHGTNDYGIYAVGTGGFAGVHAWGYSAEGLVATGLDIPSGSGKEGVVGLCGNANYAGVRGENSTSGLGVYGKGGRGVRGDASVGEGVYGRTTASSYGVYGTSLGSSGVGVRGTGPTGVEGETFTTNGTGVRGKASVAGGVGGKFGGNRAAINLIPRNTPGAPASGSHARGDVVIDSTGKMFICILGGTPGSWVRVNTTVV